MALTQSRPRAHLLPRPPARASPLALQASYDAAWIKAKTAPTRKGYCNDVDHTYLITDYSRTRNAFMCSGNDPPWTDPATGVVEPNEGAVDNLAYGFTVLFEEPNPVGTWRWCWRFKLDFGRGGVVYEDGKLAVVYKNYDWTVHWLRGSKVGAAPDECFRGWCYNGIQGDPGNYVDAGCYDYTQGPHNFSIHVFEDCCDGIQQVQFSRGVLGGGDPPFVDLTDTALDDIINNNDGCRCVISTTNAAISCGSFSPFDLLPLPSSRSRAFPSLQWHFRVRLADGAALAGY